MLEQHTRAGATMGTDGPNSSHGDWSLWGDAYGDRSRGEVGDSAEKLTGRLVDMVKATGVARWGGKRRRDAAAVGEDEDDGEATGHPSSSSSAW